MFLLHYHLKASKSIVSRSKTLIQSPSPRPTKKISRGYPTSIIDTFTKPNLVPPKGIWFFANLGSVLTQLTTWDDCRAV